MQRVSFADMNCSLARSLEILGEWWTPLILRDALLGVTRFEEFQQRLGIARNILAKRLDLLVANEVMERRCYDEARGRHEYVLTAKGRALWPVFVMLRQWGDRWVAGEGHEPARMVHTACGEQSTAQLVCTSCGVPLSGREIELVPGPGLTDETLLRRPAG